MSLGLKPKILFKIHGEMKVKVLALIFLKHFIFFIRRKVEGEKETTEAVEGEMYAVLG